MNDLLALKIQYLPILLLIRLVILESGFPKTNRHHLNSTLLRLSPTPTFSTRSHSSRDTFSRMEALHISCPVYVSWWDEQAWNLCCQHDPLGRGGSTFWVTVCNDATVPLRDGSSALIFVEINILCFLTLRCISEALECHSRYLAIERSLRLLQFRSLDFYSKSRDEVPFDKLLAIPA